MVIAVLLGCAGLGLVIGLVLFLIGLVAGLGTHPRLITPSGYRDERRKARPPRTGELELDRAWPFYPCRQWQADLGQVSEETGRRYRAIWKRPADAFFAGRHGSPVTWWFFFPIPAVCLSCLLAAGVAICACYLLFAVVSLVCVLVSGVVWSAVAVVLFGVDAGRRALLHTEASCPRCFHVTPWPAYRCTDCTVIHRDVRPGRLGATVRRCECGRLLPTMTLRAAWRLRAACQRCGKALPTGTGAVRDIRIAIFGDAAAGKTRLLYAALDSLITTEAAVGFPDRSSQDRAELGISLVRAGRDMPRTPAAPAAPVSCQLGAGPRSTFAHLFDTAGEHFKNPEMHDCLGFLDHAQGLVYVIDPFSVAWVRDRCARLGPAGFPRDRFAADDPEAAYGEVVEWLRDGGVTASTQRLAVVVTKADLMRERGLGLPADSAGIEDWLNRSHAHNLVLSAHREFAAVRFFAVASRPGGYGGGPEDPGAALRWLLGSGGGREPAVAGAGRHAGAEFGERAGART
ncbi:MAG: TRAFAC clade GTPase domain-containing protein [Streptosporangiaceae bacterium]